MTIEKPMSIKVEEYVATRRQLGYELCVTARELQRFARYAETMKHHGPLTTELVLRWARSAGTRSRLYQARRIEIVRPFAKYLASLEPGTQIPRGACWGPRIAASNRISTMRMKSRG
jgi:hypothetical protein